MVEDWGDHKTGERKQKYTCRWFDVEGDKFLVPQYPTFKLFGFLDFSSNLKVYPFISLAYWGSQHLRASELWCSYICFRV